jgi:hypothetical protein
MSESWICRSFRDGDEAGILQLYRDVFQLDLTLPVWKRAYQECPDGPAVITMLENEGRVVGHYAVQPRAFWVSGERCVAGIAIGTMVRPEVRSVAALVALAERTYAVCRERGYRWLYAFPNDSTHRVRCRLLGWQALPQITEWDGATPRSFDNDNDVEVWHEMPHGLDFDSAANRSGDDRVHGIRSGAWVYWRFFDRPLSRYVLHTIQRDGRVSGYAVTKQYNREGVLYGHLVDWEVVPGKTSDHAKLLNSVWRQLGQWNVTRVSTWALGDLELENQLAAAGLSRSGRSTNLCWYDLGGDTMVPPEDTSWQIRMADSDVF